MVSNARNNGNHADSCPALAYIYGEKVTPCAQADIKGNVSVVVVSNKGAMHTNLKLTQS